MRLSEAIRAGALLRPQSFAGYFSKTGSCAIGAAFEAIGEVLRDGDGNPVTWRGCLLCELWPILAMQAQCPVAGTTHVMSAIIFCLNDDSRWSREAIAEWVETVERRLGLWDDAPSPNVEAVKAESHTEYVQKANEYSFK